jgi:hypothetical protein
MLSTVSASLLRWKEHTAPNERLAKAGTRGPIFAAPTLQRSPERLQRGVGRRLREPVSNFSNWLGERKSFPRQSTAPVPVEVNNDHAAMLEGIHSDRDDVKVSLPRRVG